jgi:hypothetical protein
VRCIEILKQPIRLLCASYQTWFAIRGIKIKIYKYGRGPEYSVT